MRQRLTTLAELIGAGLIATGAGAVYVPAGLIVAGAFLIGLGWLLGRDAE